MSELIADPRLVGRLSTFLGSPDVARGASEFTQARGLARPTPQQLNDVVISPEHQERLAQAYERAPEFDPRAVKHYTAMRDETSQQFDMLTRSPRKGGLGIDVHVQDTDPYHNAGEMVRDINENHRLRILSTRSTGEHPVFTNDENDRFRAVHDAFGHAGTGRGFDRHGEEAAYRSHAAMFSPMARHALATETRGQNAHLIRRGTFAPQKIAILPHGTADLAPGALADRQRLLLQGRQFTANQFESAPR